MVARDEVGRPSTVRYEAVNAMLLNEFLKARRLLAEQDHRLKEQNAKIANLELTLAQLASALKAEGL